MEIKSFQKKILLLNPYISIKITKMRTITIGLLVILYSLCHSQTIKWTDADKEMAIKEISAKSELYTKAAKDIWSYAELGFQENRSTAVLQGLLKEAGFSIQIGVSGMPTAFIASYGKGKPVIGILAEFDALPGLSQDSLPERKIVQEGAPGHACGHHLFGVASVASAVALKNWLLKSGKSGTIKLYGTPAEEGGGAKVYMVRDGWFDGVDAVIHWHPGSGNQASPSSCLAIKQTIFKFHGKSSHAAAAPHAGRSALDGLEAMNNMVNLMREHVPSEARIHYVIVKGGLAANVVPDYAEAEYMVRHPDARMVEEIWNRIVKAAQGAAMGTETTVEHEVISGSFNLAPNETLSRIMHENLLKIGGVPYTGHEIEFGKKIQSTLITKYPAIETAFQVAPFQTGQVFPASTDVGDITWVVPTAGLGTATWVPGVAPHTWQAVACGATNIGFKGMINAAQVLAMTGIDIINNPSITDKAKKELSDYVGPGYVYKSMIGDRKPPLDYRAGKN